MYSFFIAVFVFILTSSLYGFDKIVVFGDSLSDTGHLKKRMRLMPNGIYWNHGFHKAYWKGRFSNGPVWPEYLSDFLNIPYENYSIGGSTTSFRIKQFAQGPYHKLRSYGKEFLTKNMTDIVIDYLKNHETLSSETVYIVWGGANNFFDLELLQHSTFKSFSQNSFLNLWTTNEMIDNLELIRQFVEMTLSDLANIVHVLVKKGAKHILIPNFSTIPSIPFLLKDQHFEDNSVLHFVVPIFNHGLQDLVKKYENVTIVEMDKELYYLFKNKDSFGFSKPFRSYCFNGGYSFSTEKPCPLKEQNSYFFFDKVHPTSMAHCWYAYFFLKELSLEKIPSQKRYLTYCRKTFKDFF